MARVKRHRPKPSQVALGARRMTVDFLRRGSKEKYLDEAERNDPFVKTDLWYERECENVSAALVLALARNGISAVVVKGSFAGLKLHFAGHAWVEFPDGTWIDPTSAQCGLPACVILPPGDDRRRYYSPALD